MSGSKQYSIAEARSNLPAIVNEAEAGVEVKLTRRGKPIAVVISLQKWERIHAKRPRFSDAYRDFLRQHSLEDVGLEDEFVASLRDRSAGRTVGL